MTTLTPEELNALPLGLYKSTFLSVDNQMASGIAIKSDPDTWQAIYSTTSQAYTANDFSSAVMSVRLLLDLGETL